MVFADALNLLLFPTPVLALLMSVSWYLVFDPPYVGRFTSLRKRHLRRREFLRVIYLILALCCTVLYAASLYDLAAEGR
ncbi:MAG: hypothetical protein M3362_02590 [Acidobacteriota bacterium]|nr:hypothetical protein [Acidobacteriota bacterium]